jgi:hypothetical protein
VRKIPAPLHSLSEYGISTLLILRPHAVGFPRRGRPNRFMRLMAAGNIGFSAITNNRVGLVRWVPMKWHVATHLVMDAFLAVSPWLLGFKTRSKRSWLPFVLLGLSGIAGSAITRRRPW